MRLNWKAAFKALLRGLTTDDDSHDDSELPVSIVLLLRQPQFVPLPELRKRAERAFATPFCDSMDSTHFIVRRVLFTFMKAGSHTLSFLNMTRPYGDVNMCRDLRLDDEQQQLWAEHSAWTAVDYVRGTSTAFSLRTQYTVVAKLCKEMIDENCVGLYLPREQVMVSNDHSVIQRLDEAIVRLDAGLN